jgi:hypothetical protein
MQTGLAAILSTPLRRYAQYRVIYLFPGVASTGNVYLPKISQNYRVFELHLSLEIQRGDAGHLTIQTGGVGLLKMYSVPVPKTYFLLLYTLLFFFLPKIPLSGSYLL